MCGRPIRLLGVPGLIGDGVQQSAHGLARECHRLCRTSLFRFSRRGSQRRKVMRDSHAAMQRSFALSPAQGFQGTSVMNKTRISSLIATAALAINLAGCVVAPGPPYVAAPAPYPYYAESTLPPPVPRAEIVGVAPYPGYFWIAGYWGWASGRYLWHPGYWEAPRQGYRWVPHQWTQHGGAWRAQPGHWERRH